MKSSFSIFSRPYCFTEDAVSSCELIDKSSFIEREPPASNRRRLGRSSFTPLKDRPPFLSRRAKASAVSVRSEERRVGKEC